MKVFADISLFWLIPVFLLSLGIAYLYYKNQKQVSQLRSKTKGILIGLRALVLFLLFLLLIGLIFEDKELKSERPLLITLVDNSSSMLNYKDSASVAARIESVNKELTERFSQECEIVNYTIDKETKEENPNYTGESSSLENGFEFIFEKYYRRNIGAICFISDGNFNQGKHPVYAAEKIKLTPVFTIGVGDTVVKRDQLIRNVAANDIAFLNNQFPIEVAVQANKLKGEQTEVSLWDGEVKLGSELVSFNESVYFQSVSFTIDAKKVGFNRYTVKLKDLANESSYENNVKSIYVEVVDSRSKVLILTDAPHPDITAIKQVLEKDKNIEVQAKTFEEWEGKIKDYSLLIVKNPGKCKNQQLTGSIKEADTPLMLLLGSGSSFSTVNDYNIGLSIPSGNRDDLAQGSIAENFQLFELSDGLSQELKNWPPLGVKFGKYDYTAGKTLVYQRIGAVLKKDPLISFKTVNNRKIGVVFGQGIWKWKLAEYQKTKGSKYFNELIQKSVQYLTVKKNNEPLRISFPNKLLESDDIIINGAFYDESLEPITDPAIKLSLNAQDGAEINYEFAKKVKSYELNLGKLKEGAYTWKASTEYAGRSYVKGGTFVVEDVSIENLETNANHNALMQIAAKTNGTFYNLSSVDNLYNDIAKRTDINTVVYEESIYSDLIDWKSLFFLAILLLTVEWMIRRYLGSY